MNGRFRARRSRLWMTYMGKRRPTRNAESDVRDGRQSGLRIFLKILMPCQNRTAGSKLACSVLRNVEGARAVNTHAIQFTDAEQVEADLAGYGIRLATGARA
jgi:hypothetical protein